MGGGEDGGRRRYEHADGHSPAWSHDPVIDQPQSESSLNGGTTGSEDVRAGRGQHNAMDDEPD